MKTISRLALALALTTGAGSLVLTPPAIAKKKEEEAQGPKLSPEALQSAQAAQTALNAKDLATAEPAIAQMESVASTDDDKYFAGVFRYNLEQQKIAAQRAANPNAPVDETVLAKPLDVLIASPVTKPEDKAKFAYQRGLLAYNGKQYPVAIQYLTQAKQLGNTDPNLPLQLAQAKVGSGDVAGGLTDLEAATTQMAAAGEKPPEDIFRYGVSRANQAKLTPQTVSWLQRYVSAYPTAKNWRQAIVTYGLAGNSVAQLNEAQKIDLFRLMRATGSLADQNDYLEYADYVQRRGLPAEAQAVVKEGQAAGKIPAANTNARQILTDAATALKTEGSLAPLEAKARSGANGKLAAGTADAYLGSGEYAKAASLYRVALEKGGVDADEVNTRLGIALARGGDKAGAKTAFGAVQAAPRSGIAALWSTYVDAPAAAAGSAV